MSACSSATTTLWLCTSSTLRMLHDYHEFGYGGIFFVPGTRLSRGQMLDILHVLVDQAPSEELAMFRDAIALDLPV
jgi:hypothetical protein